LHFKLQCSPNLKSHSVDPSSCVPVANSENSDSNNGKTSRASNVLLNLLQPDSSSGGINSGTSDPDFESTYEFVQVIGSTLLNGLPVLGLDDWFSLADFMNANINTDMRERLMRYTSIKGRFINLLGVRNLKLLFTPDNCWTHSLIEHLNKTTTNFRVSIY
jgi:hypothetical protein